MHEPFAFQKVDGLQHIDKVIEVDQSPIGRTHDQIRLPIPLSFRYPGPLCTTAKQKSGAISRTLSFNVKADAVKMRRAGLRLIEMEFLPDVYVHCSETCKGKHITGKRWKFRFKGKINFRCARHDGGGSRGLFENQPKILRKVETP